MFVTLEVLDDEAWFADGHGAVAVSNTPGLPLEFVAQLLRSAADALDSQSEERVA